MLQTVRDYAAQRLEESGEVGAVRRRHFQHFLGLATTAEPLIRGGQQLAWLSHLERDHDNLRAALDWCATAPDAGPDGLRLATSLGWFWYLRGHRAEGRARLEALLALEAGVPRGRRSLPPSAPGPWAWRPTSPSGPGPRGPTTGAWRRRRRPWRGPPGTP